MIQSKHQISGNAIQIVKQKEYHVLVELPKNMVTVAILIIRSFFFIWGNVIRLELLGSGLNTTGNANKCLSTGITCVIRTTNIITDLGPLHSEESDSHCSVKCEQD
jgi:hypothetical protein